jgi:predicted transcriptional regulator
MVEKNRQSKGEKHSLAILPGRERGESHYAHKLTDADVIEMRRIFSTTKTMAKELAARFGVSEKTAKKAISGETWKHLPGATFDNGRGEKHRFSKLTSLQVVEIRIIRATTGRSYQSIADQYGLGMRTVADILTGKTWNHLQTPGETTHPETV